MKFICNCQKPLFSNKKYSYWEKRKTTSDEMDIINKISNDKNIVDKNILHIGIGNSELATKLHSSNNIFGITISNNEIEYGNSLKLKNYKIFSVTNIPLILKKLLKILNLI